ncbi:BaiN/RdsA family NAD(P)/FAD-dependent oxidoreductase [Marinibacterium profundimaris]|uniref:Membrane protein n=1 Tax=Marinibacterium profundimaris TaxID=1679460 RepID=A0A225NT27_9RHOB|nr:NAD(P)/FAD-dependent oxidoreductase [Marinibacterium profundimaris]OWU77979.1 membrane protein [Marinibacterium profundimaris]
MDIDTLILGAGAAGLFAAAHAGAAAGRRVLVVDHARAPGEKIRISGGGRCNFTNMFASPECYLSANPHFCKSALARYTQWDFIAQMDRHGIDWHEKTLGQLFCDGSARQVIDMLLAEMAPAELWLNTALRDLSHDGSHFTATLDHDGTRQTVTARQVIVATGGKSIPKMGATGLAYDIARQFGLPVTETRPALVPFTFPEGRFKPLSGVSLPARLSNTRTSFDEALLFTHRGLSGPSVLQLSSYWREGEEIRVNLLPDRDALDWLRAERATAGRRQLGTVLAQALPSRLVPHLDLPTETRLADLSDKSLSALLPQLTDWRLTPSGTEGYRTAEVTLGGIDTDALSSRTMETRARPNLFFIGEAVDVTGWLGGYNFQWAWSSAHAAATEIARRM